MDYPSADPFFFDTGISCWLYRKRLWIIALSVKHIQQKVVVELFLTNIRRMLQDRQGLALFCGSACRNHGRNNDIRHVGFMDFDLGFFDKDEDQVELVSNSLFSQERSHVSGMDFFRRTGATGVENPS
jgi:hypothetical protein